MEETEEIDPVLVEEQIIDAVRAQDIEELKKLLEIYAYSLSLVCIYDALDGGNLDIIKLICENTYCLKRSECPGILCIFKDNFDKSESEQLEIIKYMLSVFIENGYPIEMDLVIFHLIANLLEGEKYRLVQCLMETYYSEPKNELYPLMKKLEATVENSHELLILLHSEIKNFEHIEDYLFENIQKIFLIFVELLLIDTPETMQLAIEIFHVLLDKQIESEIVSIVVWLINESDIEEKQGVEFISPVLMKRVFQMIYYLFDTEKDWDIMGWITFWFEICSKRYKKYIQSCQCMVPFVVKSNLKRKINEIHDSYSGFEKLQQMLNGDFTSLKGICREMIITKTAEAVHYEPKELLDGLWTLNLPETLKCYLLRIPDASWINDLNL